MAAGLSFQRGNHRHRVVIGKDTRLSGYMIENAHGGRLHRRRHGRVPARPDPDAGRRHADALAARRYRRDDLGLAQSLSTTTASSCSARTATSSPTRSRRASRRCSTRTSSWRWPIPTSSAAPSASTACTTATSNSPSARCRARCRCRACGSSSIAPTAPPTRWRPRRCGNSAPRSSPSTSSPNGFNINQECGSTHPAALSKKVHEVRADIGIALDGDADRVVIVDENGEVVDGDQIMALIAESWHQAGRLAGGGVVATVMSNLGLERFLERHRPAAAPHQGRRPLRRRAHARAWLQCRRRAVRPIVLSDFSTTGDGLVAALQVLACIKRQNKPVSEICQQVRAGAAGSEERPLLRRQAAGRARRSRRRSRTPATGWAAPAAWSSARPAPSR